MIALGTHGLFAIDNDLRAGEQERRFVMKVSRFSICCEEEGGWRGKKGVGEVKEEKGRGKREDEEEKERREREDRKGRRMEASKGGRKEGRKEE